MELNQVTLPCTDYDRTVAFYEHLGHRLIVDSPPRYARFETATGTTFSLHEATPEQISEGYVLYFEVNDVDAEVERLRELGIAIEAEPRDQSWLWREAYVRDPSGNRICIFCGGENRRFPPWRLTHRS